MELKTEAKKCPKCSNFIPSNEHAGEYPGAISRRDSKTEICSACGVDEALEDFFTKN
jgi:ribosomal protein S27AE